GQAAAEAGWYDVAIKFYRTIILHHSEEPYAYYRSQAKTRFAELLQQASITPPPPGHPPRLKRIRPHRGRINPNECHTRSLCRQSKDQRPTEDQEIRGARCVRHAASSPLEVR
ncbi:MAG: hypothetical protein C4293_13750, partial [Nitrospiraceae bacterium]